MAAGGRPKSSDVWEFFKYNVDSNASECLIEVDNAKKCGKLLIGRNPTNLKRHMKACHKTQYDAVEAKELLKSQVKKVETSASAVQPKSVQKTVSDIF